jgi:uncharacterized SAM-dependent methyltransferase
MSVNKNKLKSLFKEIENEITKQDFEHFVFYCNYNQKYVMIHRSNCHLLDYDKKILDNNHFWSPEIKTYEGCKSMLNEFLRIRDFYATPLGRNTCKECIKINKVD